MGVVDTCAEKAKLNIIDMHSVVMVGGSSRIPKLGTLLADKTHKTPAASAYRPDEAVAAGAALMAGILTGAMEGALTVTDRTQFAVGIALQGGRFSCIVPAGSLMPVLASAGVNLVQTAFDQQKVARFEVYEGENDSQYITECELLDTFTIDGLPKAGAGKVKFDTMISIDTSNTLQVTAKVVRG